MDAITTAAPAHSLRERMLQDMTMRGFGAHTQKDYIRHVRSFAAFLVSSTSMDSETENRALVEELPPRHL